MTYTEEDWIDDEAFGLQRLVNRLGNRFVVMEAATRKIVHFNVTDHPTAD